MKVAFVSALVLALLAPQMAVAAHPSLDDARKLTAEATVEYNVGHFERALELYAKAYELVPKPVLLFDMGQCQRQLGHEERALFFFKATSERSRRLRIGPSSRSSSTTSLGGSKRSARPRTSESGPTKPRRPRRRKRPRPPPHDTEEAPATAANTGSDTSGKPTSQSALLQTTGLITAGLGVALIGGGVYSGLRSAHLANEISQLSAQKGTWSAAYQSDANVGRSFATAADVLYVSGAVAIATGVALAWVGWPKSAGATATVAPIPGGAHVGLIARF